MTETLLNQNYNPDVLSCLANLSNDEVFTPPKIVNAMLDMLPQELFENPDTKFLDPACKSGVFLREIAKRLLIGLQNKIPDEQQRRNHIFKEQLYGIAITELTSLLSRRSIYCSKFPNSVFSVADFDKDDIQGNILFHSIQHTWNGDKCIYCGAPKSLFGDKDKETHAYEFIHTDRPEDIFNMKFDVIIGNPPYQLDDGGNGRSAKPIYQFFVHNAKKLNPRFLSYIIPARWYTGGKGLDNFRKEMLNDCRIRKLVDYENFKDVFPGVDLAGGACYFLWDREYNGKCEVTNVSSDTHSCMLRKLNEFDVIIRSNKAISIVHKVMEVHKGVYMDETVSPSKPFGIRTFYSPKDIGVPCQFIQKIGLKFADPKDITDNLNLLNKWKVLVPRSPIAGQTDFSKPVGFYYDGNTRIVPPGTCCTESFIVVFSSDSKEQVISFKSYLYTKIVRFLLSICVVSQDITREKYKFVPFLEDYKKTYTDSILRSLWNISDEEWEYIDSRICDIGNN